MKRTSIDMAVREMVEAHCGIRPAPDHGLRCHPRQVFEQWAREIAPALAKQMEADILQMMRTGTSAYKVSADGGRMTFSEVQDPRNWDVNGGVA